MTSPPRSLWVPPRAELSQDIVPPFAADVVVLGAGIVGATTALLLRRAGVDVALVEARRVGEQATGGSSAKVTSHHALRYSELTSTFNEVVAAEYGSANEWAIRRIEGLASELEISCDFERRPSYVYTIDPDRVQSLEEDARLAARLGLPARFTTDVPLPFPTQGAVVFEDQAQFDPYAYVAGLVRAFRALGGRLLEGVRVEAIDDSGSDVRLSTGRGDVRASRVVVATNLPVLDDGKYFLRATPRAHFVIAARMPAEPVAGMFISIDDPSRSLRSAHRGDEHWLVSVGRGFKAGEHDPPTELAELEGFVSTHFPGAAVTHRWWNEDYYSVDHLPFVGPVEKGRERVLIATGFGGWGLTNGVIAGHILADRARGLMHRWAPLFDSTRTWGNVGESPVRSAVRVVTDNAAVAVNLVRRVIPAGTFDQAQLERGAGTIATIEGEQLAIARDDAGAVHAVTATCTHLGCEVAWNGPMQTWDCGCHGSCFDIDGAVLRCPAVHPLQQRTLPTKTAG
ncbi:MAG: FAD-dependent oxidoreductase [Dehalococcoidia bacterium]